MILTKECLVLDRELQVINITSAVVAAEYLPEYHERGKIPSVKIDLALGYDSMARECLTIRSLREHNTSHVCPLKGGKEKSLLTCVPVEVKTMACRTVYTEVQLSIFGCAMLQVC